MLEKSHALYGLDWEQLAAYFAGELAPGDRARLESWIENDPARRQEVLALRQLWETKRTTPRWASNPEHGWARISSQIDSADSIALQSGRGDTRTTVVDGVKGFQAKALTRVGVAPRWAAIAALALVGVFAVTEVTQYTRRGHDQRVTFAGTYKSYATQPGQRATIDLRDGTRVQLDVASRLDIPSNFGITDRTVRLHGHATFAVAHAKTQPFVVDAKQTRTTVLGTTFSVRAYEGDVRVAVQSGKVAVAACAVGEGACNTSAKQVVLSENDRASVTPFGQIHSVRDTDLNVDFAFTTGRLFLVGEPLERIVADIDRWYDVDVRLGDSVIGTRALEGWLTAGTADDLVQFFTVVLKAKVERQGRVITLYAPSIRSAHETK